MTTQVPLATPDSNTLTPAPIESLGKLFQQTRLLHQLELAAVAHRLRVKETVIEAIENDAFEVLGAPVYARMYLQRYAELLDLPTDDIMQRFKQLGLDQPPPLKVSHLIQTQTRASDFSWLVLPLVFVALGWLGWLGVERFILAENPIVMTTDDADADAAAITNDNALASNPNPPGSEAVSAMSSTQTDSEDAPNPSQAANGLPESTSLPDNTDAAIGNPLTGLPRVFDSEVTVSATATVPLGTGASPTVSGTVRTLVMEFTDDCWVEVKNATGELLLYGTIKANEIRSLSDPGPFSIKFGNAYAARLTLDGKVIDRSVYIPERGTVSRFQLAVPPAVPPQG